MNRIGNGVYGVAEAARLARVSKRALREWFFSRRASSALAADYAAVDGSLAVSFLDLVDAKMAALLRTKQMSMQRLRRTYDALQSTAGAHPFARASLFFDGTKKTLWVRAGGSYFEALSGQHGLPPVVTTFLEELSFDPASGLANEWAIARGVVISPAHCFGKPATARSRRPTRVLSAAYGANGHDITVVADYYNVDPEEVSHAVAFERQLAA